MKRKTLNSRKKKKEIVKANYASIPQFFKFIERTKKKKRKNILLCIKLRLHLVRLSLCSLKKRKRKKITSIYYINRARNKLM